MYLLCKRQEHGVYSQFLHQLNIIPAGIVEHGDYNASCFSGCYREFYPQACQSLVLFFRVVNREGGPWDTGLFQVLLVQPGWHERHGFQQQLNAGYLLLLSLCASAIFPISGLFLVDKLAFHI